jgi:hypothetical protein
MSKTRSPVSTYGLTPPPARGRDWWPRRLHSLAFHHPRDLAGLVVPVTLAGIQATQASVRNSSMRRHGAGVSPGYHGDSTPLLVICDGTRYLMDGHHRTCVALSEHRTEMLMTVWDFDDEVVTGMLKVYMLSRDAATAGHGTRLDAMRAKHDGPIFPLVDDTIRREFEASYQQSEREREVALQRLRNHLSAHYSGPKFQGLKMETAA